MSTRIEWTHETWSPVTGCSNEFPCWERCYARRMANRLRGRAGYDQADPFRVTVHEDRFEQPSKWRNPREIFVCSMGDLFHKDVPGMAMWRVVNTAHTIRGHTFIFLTKRTGAMVNVLAEYYRFRPSVDTGHVWFGTSMAGESDLPRMGTLSNVGSPNRWISYEPALGPVEDWRAVLSICGIKGVVCGCETGPGARPMHLDWARACRDGCAEAGATFFFKAAMIDGKRVSMPPLDGVVHDALPWRIQNER